MGAHKIPMGQRLFSAIKADGACWIWTKARDRDGYGLIKFNKKMLRVHRFIFESLYGQIPPENDICHQCDNPPCFRPSHLFSATKAENQHDKVRKGRQATGTRTGFRLNPWKIRPDAVIGNWKKTHCPHGILAPAFDCVPCEARRVIKREEHKRWRNRLVK